MSKVGWRFGSGIAGDIRGRIPLYVDDWRQGLSRKALSATIYMFFTNVLPAITFALVLSERTHGHQGVFEVLLSMAVGGTLFALIAGQPLVIVGVTGPVCVFCATVYDLAAAAGLDYAAFFVWISLWAAAMHVVLAGLGACSAVRFVTPFSGEIFGALISLIYAFEGCSELARQLSGDSRSDSALLALILGVATFAISRNLARAQSWSIGTRRLREALADYGPAVAVVLCSAAQFLPAFAHVPLRMLRVPPEFGPSIPRPWVPPFWSVPGWAIAAALGPAAFLTALLFFDHNISSLLAQAPERGLKKPPSYHWDFALLGGSLVLTGLLGLPPNYGLIPQAPLHVRALADIEEVTSGAVRIEVWKRVCETRVSALGQSLLMMLMLSRPLLSVLGYVPTGVLAGQFMFLALSGFDGSSIARRLHFLALEREARSGVPALSELPLPVVFMFTALQLVLVAVIFGATLTPAGLAFPLFILALVPLRQWALPRMFSLGALTVLDVPLLLQSAAPTAEERVGSARGVMQTSGSAGGDSSLLNEIDPVVANPVSIDESAAT
jgi:boron transporter